MNVPEISPTELKSELDAGIHVFLLDVREDVELAISALPNIVHVPMNEVPDRIGELPNDANIVVVCRSGARSGRVTAYLQQLGFLSVRNLATGMNGWAQTVDPTVTTY
jgi:rhodanese-related sulfurtransferase